MFFFILVIFCIQTCYAWDQVQWAIENGAYLHPHLQYRNHGMFADKPIDKGEVLAKIPESLEYKCISCKDQVCKHCDMFQLAEKFKKEQGAFWRPYKAFLSEKCRNPLCQRHNMSVLTVLGSSIVDYLHPNGVDNFTSSVLSRGWMSGLRPLLELFNHDESGLVPKLEEGEYVLRASKRIEKNEEAYDNYGIQDVFHVYTNYGFIPNVTPNCYAMRAMRIGNASERLSCIVESNSSMTLMISEMYYAFKINDTTMMKAIAQWIDKNITLH